MATDTSAREVSTPEHGLHVDAVTKRFGETVALDGVSLEGRAGEFLTILGPSGCGKTTLLRLVAGFDVPTAGRIAIAGRVVSDGHRGVIAPPERRDIGMVFQSYAVWPHLTVARNVAYPLRLKRRPREEIHRRVGEALELVDLGRYADRLPAQLSGGQQQRVALARAVVAEPTLLLLDEPLSNLDARLRVRMRRDLRRIQRELGIATVLVTHDQDEALELSDRVVVMSSGRIQQVGHPEALYRRPANAFVAEFLGSANLLHGQGDGTAWRLPCGARLPLAEPAPEEEGALVVRPEDLDLLLPGDDAEVTSRLFSGPSVIYTLRCGRQPLTAVGRNDVELAPGDRVGLCARRAHPLPGVFA